MLPSEFPEVKGYQSLKRLLEAQVDMQFGDLRTLLLTGGCNFVATAVLFNLIAGTSVCFYDASEEALVERGTRGNRFKEVLDKFYPWGGELLPKDQCVKVLYERARNPLAHSLGLDAPPKGSTGKQVVLIKWTLTEAQVCELEESSSRPAWAPPTIVHQKPLVYGSVELAISVPTLYWGVHRMLHALFSDSAHATKADALARSFSPQWDKYASDSGRADDAVVSLERLCSRCSAELMSTDGGRTFKCPRCNG